MNKKTAGWLCAAAIAAAFVFAVIFFPAEKENLPKAKQQAEVFAKTDRKDKGIQKEREGGVPLPKKDEAIAGGGISELFSEEPQGTLMLHENFDYAADTFGFDAASVKDGKLGLTGIDAGEVSVKAFDPVILRQSVVEVSFLWNSSFSDGQGKSGLEFRDLYGRLIFAISAGLDESTNQPELRYSATGAANSLKAAIEPEWNAVSYAPGAVYGIFFRADFDEKKVDAFIYDENRVVAAKLEGAATDARGLAKMAACKYGQVGSPPEQTLDDFRIYASNDAGELPFAGKNAIAFGDSIVDGHLWKEAGFVEFLAAWEGMHLEYNYANNGAQIMPGSVVNPADGLGGTIRDCQISQAAAENRDPDYIIFDGGANDAYSGILGRLGTVKETDASTFAGAFRSTIRAMHRAWPNAKLIYVAVPKLKVREEYTQDQLHSLAIAICQDMGVAVADLYRGGWDTSDEEMNQKYAFDALDAGQIPVGRADSNGVHPNFLAIEEFYVPAVAEALRRAGTVTISDQEMADGDKPKEGSSLSENSKQQAASIVFEEESYQIAAGKTVVLKAKIKPDLDAFGLNWGIVSNPNYASIAAAANQCEVKTKKAGAGKKVTVFAQADDGSGIKKEVSIQLMKHAVTKISIRAKKQSVRTGAKLLLKAVVRTSGSLANKKLKWTASDSSVVVLKPNKDGSQCVLTAKAAGAGKTIILTAEATDGTGVLGEMKVRIW